MEFQLSYFRSSKMMLWKFCTQYASKSEKFSSGYRTGKGQFSFHFQGKTMPKNVQTTAQLHSLHIIARSCSKSSKLGFNSIWTKNFQIYKLDLHKAEEQEIKMPTSVRSSKKQESSRETSTSASLKEGDGNWLQYSCLGNPMDRGAWCATVHSVTKSQTWLIS